MSIDDGDLCQSVTVLEQHFRKSGAAAPDMRPAAFTARDFNGRAEQAALNAQRVALQLHGEMDTYLKATLEAIAAGHPQIRIDDLLPWNFTRSS